MRAHCFQHVPFEGLGTIEPWLRDRGTTITTTRFYGAAALPPVDDVELLIVMGGPMSVNDDHEYAWLADERRFIRHAIEHGKAVVGVCLGAQLIASAMGARVYRNPEREIGWFPIVGADTSGRGPAWAAAGTETMVFHWHGETFDLPSGATHLARSQGCEHQAFSLGPRVIGLQFHLEMTPASIRAIVDGCRNELTASRFVQAERDILSADAARFAATHAMMADVLQRVTGAGVTPT